MITALTNATLKGGSCQLRSRNSRTPWNKPQSTSTCACPASISYFEPVTVPAAPQNERDDMALDFSESKISEAVATGFAPRDSRSYGVSRPSSTGCPRQTEADPLRTSHRLLTRLLFRS